MGDRFELQPKEAALRGTSLSDGTLRIGATGPQRVSALLCGIVAAALAGIAATISAGGRPVVNGVRVDHPVPAIVALVALACGLLAEAVAIARAAVVATPTGLDIRGRWRRRRLTWGEVVDLQAVDTIPGRPAHPEELTARQLIDRRTADSVGVVVTRNGTAFELVSCTSRARSEGWAAHETPAEVKVAALRRYHDHVGGSLPPHPPISYAEVSRGMPLVAELAIAIFGPPAVWAVLNVVTDDPIDLGSFVIPWAVLIMVTVWSQRDRLVHLLRTAGARSDRTSTSAR